MARVSDNLTSPQPRRGDYHTAIDDNQYSLPKIMSIWAIVAVPMPILAFIIGPMLAPEGTWQVGLTIWLLLIGGMIWQFIVSVVILHQELDEFTWAAVKARIWLQAPQDPKTGKSNYKLFWWLIPAFLVYALFEGTPIASILGESILIPFPWVSSLPYLELQSLLVPELVGAWWLIPVAIVSCLFNYLLGEELLFRGILLPKMRGVFGRWDFFANAVLFAIYHLHYPTRMLGIILGAATWTLPSRRFRSIWFSIILHSFEGIFLLVGVFALVVGLAI
ncbi:MAG: CPBP family intramembrane glutamic endopeptidase [Pseudoruegeria sp.]